jgi:hypothetical protein
MDLASIALSLIGGTLTIILGVYVPRLLNSVNNLTAEFHRMNLLTEKRLSTLETMVRIQHKARSRE